MPLRRLTFIGVSPGFLKRTPRRPRSWAPVGRRGPAHFDDPVRVSHAREVNYQRRFVAWRREVGRQRRWALADQGVTKSRVKAHLEIIPFSMCNAYLTEMAGIPFNLKATETSR
jgi:hypothetical protein